MVVSGMVIIGGWFGSRFGGDDDMEECMDTEAGRRTNSQKHEQHDFQKLGQACEMIQI